MKVNLEQVRERLEVEVNGQEDWLGDIYQSFQHAKDVVVRPLKARILIERENPTIFKVSGEIHFAPPLQCSLCADYVQRDVSNQFVLRAFPAEMEVGPLHTTHGEPAASVPDGIPYENHELDLEALINDQIQLQIPIQTVRRSEDGRNCMDCGEILEDGAVYSDREGERPNPFASLTGLLKN